MKRIISIWHVEVLGAEPKKRGGGVGGEARGTEESLEARSSTGGPSSV